MKNTDKLALILLLFLAASTALAQDLDPTRHYSSFFTGLATELYLFAEPETSFPSNVRIESVAGIYTWGMRQLFACMPFRLRGGIGFWPDRDFSLQMGTELGLIEVLNSYQARMFGIYASLDGIIRFSAIKTEPGFRPALKLLFGINNLSCLGLGVVWDNKYGWLLKLDYSSGAYLLK